MEEIYYILKPELVRFDISTLDVQVAYHTVQMTIKLETQRYAEKLERPVYYTTELVFETVAEVRCVSMNFFEANYSNSEVIDIKEGLTKEEFWQTKGYCADAGFYTVIDSSLLQAKKKLYDPTNALHLVHYLIVGYDSYVEVLASRYSYTTADVPNE